jgi:hypothetical protein
MTIHWSGVLLVFGAIVFVLVVFGILACTILRSVCTQHLERRRAKRNAPPTSPLG